MKVNKKMYQIVCEVNLNSSRIIKKSFLKNTILPITKPPHFHYVFPRPRIKITCLSFYATLDFEKVCIFIKWTTFPRYQLSLFSGK